MNSSPTISSEIFSTSFTKWTSMQSHSCKSNIDSTFQAIVLVQDSTKSRRCKAFAQEYQLRALCTFGDLEFSTMYPTQSVFRDIMLYLSARQRIPTEVSALIFISAVYRNFKNISKTAWHSGLSVRIISVSPPCFHRSPYNIVRNTSLDLARTNRCPKKRLSPTQITTSLSSSVLKNCDTFRMKFSLSWRTWDELCELHADSLLSALGFSFVAEAASSSSNCWFILYTCRFVSASGPEG